LSNVDQRSDSQHDDNPDPASDEEQAGSDYRSPREEISLREYIWVGGDGGCERYKSYQHEREVIHVLGPPVLGLERTGLRLRILLLCQALTSRSQNIHNHISTHTIKQQFELPICNTGAQKATISIEIIS